jgi:hypothetical protein
LDTWVKYVRPGVNTGIVASIGAIEVARVSKGKILPMTVIKPVACALARGLDQWIHLLPVSARSQVEAITKLVTLFTCKDAK